MTPKRTDDICTEIGTVVIAVWIMAACAVVLTAMVAYAVFWR